MLKTYAQHTNTNAQTLAHGMSILTAAIAIGHGVDRAGFVDGAGQAFDEAEKRARAGMNALLVGVDGRPL